LQEINTVEQWLGEDNQLGIDIWNKKYRQDDENFLGWLDRICDGDSELRQVIINREFLFGGRILANRGINKKGIKTSYSNCYVITPPDDNIESIFSCASKLARTFSYGGGCGIDMSKLAPRGARINNAAISTSGAASFIDLYGMVTALISQQGRKGALMISLDCTHPDLEEFISLKSDLGRATKANLSIKVTNEFMQAVKTKSNFDLEFERQETGEAIRKTVNAYEVFQELARMNWDYAEPGILYWDKISKYNLLSNTNGFEYAGVNP